ncbi:MAG: hypothetical protein J6Z22_04365, partial [Lachnospiraceae bacterium]|nr:hypothetical protein [Lachnospiraceae bacterium]
KFLFFVKKGMGGQYFRGVLQGVRMSIGREARKHKVPFRGKHLLNYIKIELMMIGALTQIGK